MVDIRMLLYLCDSTNDRQTVENFEDHKEGKHTVPAVSKSPNLSSAAFLVQDHQEGKHLLPALERGFSRACNLICGSLTALKKCVGAVLPIDRLPGLGFL